MSGRRHTEITGIFIDLRDKVESLVDLLDELEGQIQAEFSYTDQQERGRIYDVQSCYSVCGGDAGYSVPHSSGCPDKKMKESHEA